MGRGSIRRRLGVVPDSVVLAQDGASETATTLGAFSRV